MKLNKYGRKAREYALYSSTAYPFLALGEEAGEVLGKIAKTSRKTDRVIDDVIIFCGEELRQELLKELGDVLWQLASCAYELDSTLEEVAKMNLDKLSGRSERGTIEGRGDDR